MATPFPGDFVDVNELRLEFVRALRSALVSRRAAPPPLASPLPELAR